MIFPLIYMIYHITSTESETTFNSREDLLGGELSAFSIHLQNIGIHFLFLFLFFYFFIRSQTSHT